jgi:hypothetical protein
VALPRSEGLSPESGEPRGCNGPLTNLQFIVSWWWGLHGGGPAVSDKCVASFAILHTDQMVAELGLHGDRIRGGKLAQSVD